MKVAVNVKSVSSSEEPEVGHESHGTNNSHDHKLSLEEAVTLPEGFQMLGGSFRDQLLWLIDLYIPSSSVHKAANQTVQVVKFSLLFYNVSSAGAP